MSRTLRTGRAMRNSPTSRANVGERRRNAFPLPDPGQGTSLQRRSRLIRRTVPAARVQNTVAPALPRMLVVLGAARKAPRLSPSPLRASVLIEAAVVCPELLWGCHPGRRSIVAFFLNLRIVALFPGSRIVGVFLHHLIVEAQTFLLVPVRATSSREARKCHTQRRDRQAFHRLHSRLP